MEIVNFDKEFVERTKWIVNNLSCQYEITLLLNCMLALVALPTERTKGQQNGTATDDEFQKNCINKLKEMGLLDGQKSSDRQIFRTVKNALSHMYIEPVNQNQMITCVKICDKVPGEDRYHTELNFSVEQLKEFALYVADLHLARFENEKNVVE